MMLMRRRMACCSREREMRIDFEEQQGMMTYNGLETCIINNQSYEDESRTSRGDGCLTDSLDDDAFSSCSSSKDAFGSFSSKCLPGKREEHGSDYWDFPDSPQHFYAKEKPAYPLHHSDVEAMKEKFSKLLLGEDSTGGRKGVQTALALSNAITNLATSVFGELWKLEPLSEEKKDKWQREMDWLLSPTNYMIELVPSKQNGANGRSLEIMTPKARADIHMNLPALQKLDSMLIGTLDSMVNTEFWYDEVGRRAEGKNKSTRESKRWWLPLPQVPRPGLSDSGRKELLDKGKVVYQVFKAAKSINENVLLEMPVPTIIRDAIPKSGKASLGDELYRMLAADSTSIDEILSSLKMGTENTALETANRLEAAIFAWKERIAEQTSTGRSPVRTSWSFMKDPLSETGRIESLLNRAGELREQIKAKFPNLPQSFLDATKIQYGKDIGHAILEAYSRILVNLAFRILSRMGEILQEDALSNPNSPAPPSCFPGTDNLCKTPERPLISSRVRHSLLVDMNKADGTSKADGT
ncbi:PREDICTED: rop guanine nucleotide exchange factor 14 isoform X1 [Tarenaya hassleriana]|uniref:rop guanine nucleotide exchange factor 14 isoform X1 n=1 Tax=Tarenaya hassleriana TaxID=28532 RepID=UPI00053C70B7|nr:PREDICTED: rop guanine nucleotide exchange factor 14 isoform X1 [Tarenaya hassleriana]XP_010538327.1 PREDICTED: rop guanine nucleotide exchange factor 14 isoform X1 [Tarenaya hassleriana]XP_010538328.1 PREDICTED: rop guanine nucleotide exchange factor 14 isoform X1 [Tarenaya hassleriana]